MTLTSSERIPLEQLFAVATGKRALTVGIPAPEGPARRFPLTPEGAAMLTAREIDVRIEKGAGAAIHYTDTRYIQAGARIVSRAEAFACDIVICLSPLNPEDARRLRRGALLLTVLDALMTSPAVALLLEKQVVTIALDLIADNEGHAPFADVLNEIDGRAAMAASSALLADAEAGKGILLGGVAGIIPCEVTVIGAGIGGMSAARSAMGMGALVRMFDSDVYRLRRAAERLGPGVVTSSMHPRVLVNALRTADVVVASVGHIPSRRTNVGLSLMRPFVISCNFVIVMSSYNSEIGIGRAAIASAAFLTARAYALEVMVEAVMASRLPPSFLTVRALDEIASSASKIFRLRNCP